MCSAVDVFTQCDGGADRVIVTVAMGAAFNTTSYDPAAPLTAPSATVSDADNGVDVPVAYTFTFGVAAATTTVSANAKQ